MIRTARFIFTLAAAILLQVSFFPVWLGSPFIPNLTLFFVVHLGLREQGEIKGKREKMKNNTNDHIFHNS